MRAWELQRSRSNEQGVHLVEIATVPTAGKFTMRMTPKNIVEGKSRRGPSGFLYGVRGSQDFIEGLSQGVDGRRLEEDALDPEGSSL